MSATCSGTCMPNSSTQLSRRMRRHCCCSQVCHVFVDQLLRQGPGGVGVGKIVGPQEALDVQLIGHVQRGPVILECHVDVVKKILGGQFAQGRRLVPEAVPVVNVVHAVGVVRRPACIRFHADDLERRETVKHAGVDQHPDDVLATANHIEQGIDFWSAMAAVGRVGEDVKTQGQPRSTAVAQSLS